MYAVQNEKLRKCPWLDFNQPTSSVLPLTKVRDILVGISVPTSTFSAVNLTTSKISEKY
jgi:hypothetical protein